MTFTITKVTASLKQAMHRYTFSPNLASFLCHLRYFVRDVNNILYENNDENKTHAE